MYQADIVGEMPIDSVFEMEDVVKAYEKILTHRAKGKIVVRVQDPDAYKAHLPKNNPGGSTAKASEELASHPEKSM
jgi:hypothetical protein